MKYNNLSQSNQLIRLLTNFKLHVEIVDEQGFKEKQRVNDKFLNDFDKILDTNLSKEEKKGGWSYKAFFYETLIDTTKTLYEKCKLLLDELMPDLLDKSTGDSLLSEVKNTLRKSDRTTSEKLLHTREEVHDTDSSEPVIPDPKENFSNLSKEKELKKRNNLTLFNNFKKEIISTYKNNEPNSEITEGRFKGTKFNNEEKTALVNAAHEKDFFDVGQETLLDEKYYKQELPSKGNKAEQLDRALADMLQEMEYNESIKKPSPGK